MSLLSTALSDVDSAIAMCDLESDREVIRRVLLRARGDLVALAQLADLERVGESCVRRHLSVVR